ncbi:hypothetical protein BMS3Bbin16_01047 [archaeon BMS3Bbin16]|nr:hypothetical protein BMS3Bbin16_01047 [archaeon BMS3Bbin16]
MDIYYGSFEEGIKRFVFGLNLDRVEIEKDKRETPKTGVDYFARIKAKIKSDFFFGGGTVEVDFHVQSETESKNIKNWDSLLYNGSIYLLKNGIVVTSFHKVDRFYQSDKPPEIWEWAGNLVEAFNDKRIKDRIGFMFGDSSVIALPPDANYVQVILRGLVASGEEELLIFKIRHVNGGFESFSYAINLGDWFVFPVVGTSVSGSAIDIKKIDSLIEELNSNLTVCLIEFDVDLKELEDKFLKELYGIRRDFYDDLNHKIKNRNLPDDIRQEYALEFLEIQKDFDDKKFLHALRNLRSLLEESGKYLCELNGIKVPENATKKIILPLIIKNEILEPRLDSWFDAFYAIANKAAHSVSLQDLNVFEQQYFLQQAIIIGELLYFEILSKIEKISDPTYLK